MNKPRTNLCALYRCFESVTIKWVVWEEVGSKLQHKNHFGTEGPGKITDNVKTTIIFKSKSRKTHLWWDCRLCSKQFQNSKWVKNVWLQSTLILWDWHWYPGNLLWGINNKTVRRYHTRAIITRGLYTFYPILGEQFFVFMEVFQENCVLVYC